MDILVKNRVHKCFSDIENYHSFTDLNKNIKDYPIDLEEGENPLGVYENVPDQIEESIIITDQALYYCDDNNHSRKTRYQDIIEAITPDDKFTDNILKVRMKDGKHFLLPIRRLYEGARMSNIFTFISFINRIVWYLTDREIASRPPEILKEEADKILKDPSVYSDDYIAKMILVLSRKEINFESAEKMCRAFIDDSRIDIRTPAIYSVSRIAYAYKKLVSDDILNVLKEIYKNKTHKYWGVVDEVYGDLEAFLKIPKPKNRPSRRRK